MLSCAKARSEAAAAEVGAVELCFSETAPAEMAAELVSLRSLNSRTLANPAGHGALRGTAEHGPCEALQCPVGVHLRASGGDVATGCAEGIEAFEDSVASASRIFSGCPAVA